MSEPSQPTSETPDGDSADAVQQPPAKQSKNESGRKSASFHRYPLYAPRFWHGMRPKTWWRLLRDGNFRIYPSRLGFLIGISFATPFNTLMAWVQQLFYGHKLKQTQLHGPPVFIIGHWRSGTTLLHELMVLDERYSSPSTFQCFAPHHFLITEWIFRRFFKWMLPGKRPMDNMAAGWDRPQEDEFALMNLGLHSPYRSIAFPRQDPMDLEYLDFEGVSEEDVRTWIDGLRGFLKSVSFTTGRPLVIKSPTHTGRLAALAEAFPEARFIHVARDPRALFPSTFRLWHSLADVQGLQPPFRPEEGSEQDQLEQNRPKQYVIQCLKKMYDAFLPQREALPAQRMVCIRYEDLIADPVETLEHIYSSLRLSDFQTVRPVIDEWVKNEHRSYKTNKHQLSADDEQTIQQEWKHYFEAFDY